MNYDCERLNRFIDEGRMDELVYFSEQRIRLQYEMLFNEIRVADRDYHDECITDAIMVTGPSSSGKTTFSNMLAKRLINEGYNCTVISLDNYYLERDKIKKKQMALGRNPKNDDDFDYETIEAFDVSFFKKQMRTYLKGEEIALPEYDFVTGTRKFSENRIKFTSKDMIIVEGIQSLNPVLTKGIGFSNVFKVYICPFDYYSGPEKGQEMLISPRDIRFMRRAIRDSHKRDSSVTRTMDMWPNVRLGEEKYIKPMKKFADFFMNSSYEYELPYLISGIMPIYEALSTKEKKRFNTILNTENLKYFKLNSHLDIPEDSIFNEFYFA